MEGVSGMHAPFPVSGMLGLSWSWGQHGVGAASGAVAINLSPDVAQEMSRKCQGARAGWSHSPRLEGPIDLLSEIDAADFEAYAGSARRMKY